MHNTVYELAPDIKYVIHYHCDGEGTAIFTKVFGGACVLEVPANIKKIEERGLDAIEQGVDIVKIGTQVFLTIGIVKMLAVIAARRIELMVEEQKQKLDLGQLLTLEKKLRG